MAALKAVVLAGPDAAVDKIERWRVVDLCDRDDPGRFRRRCGCGEPGYPLHRHGFTTELVERQQTWHALGPGFWCAPMA